MSTQTNTYGIIGVKLPYDAIGEDEDERFEPYMDSAFKGIQHHDGVCILKDGMNGEYIIAGWVIAKSDEYGHLPEPVAFPLLSRKEKKALEGKLAALFPQHPIVLQEIVLTHYR